VAQGHEEAPIVEPRNTTRMPDRPRVCAVTNSSGAGIGGRTAYASSAARRSTGNHRRRRRSLCRHASPDSGMTAEDGYGLPYTLAATQM
jgi:hypothetical protein